MERFNPSFTDAAGMLHTWALHINAASRNGLSRMDVAGMMHEVSLAALRYERAFKRMANERGEYER